MATKDKKRENFEVTPDQEAEIDCFQQLIKAPTRKDAMLTAIRLGLHLVSETRKGYQIFLGNEQSKEFRRVIMPGIEAPNLAGWKYLVQRPHEWKTQLYVKGRRLPAATAWIDMLVSKMTAEEAADDWDLPIEAIEEIIAYCEQNRALLEMEAAEEGRRLEEKGFVIEPKVAS